MVDEAGEELDMPSNPPLLNVETDLGSFGVVCD
jgi:hypothetical protein